MKKTLYILLTIMLVLGFVACSDYEEVIIHHEPYLNIFANVTAADKSFNFVNVYRTTAFGEPDNYEIDSIIYHQFYNESSGDTITYETFYIDTSYAVNDAKVYFLHQGDTIKFKESIQGIYHPVDTNYTIITGDEYQLYVETEDFGIATAVEEALPPINWQQAKDDTIWISLSNPVDTLWWSDLGGAYYVRFLVHTPIHLRRSKSANRSGPMIPVIMMNCSITIPLRIFWIQTIIPIPLNWKWSLTRLMTLFWIISVWPKCNGPRVLFVIRLLMISG
jgi:hypothetical protein